MHSNPNLIDENTYRLLFSQGLVALPVRFDDQRTPTDFPLHDAEKLELTIEYTEKLLRTSFRGANGLAIKLFPPFGMFDFDLKNSKRKDIYDEWFRAISVHESILKKVCIERTKSAGYHVYIKYAKLNHKIPVARSEKGMEVISVYTGGLLSFCAPSPGYEIIHNDFNDLDFLTDQEFEIMVTTAALFHEDPDRKTGETKVHVTEYPTEYESVCLQFDHAVTDDVWERMLNDIGLERVKDDRFKRQKYVPFLRKGSSAAYSAKAYFRSKKLLIFSASMSQFPTWHDSARAGDGRWSLTPSKILYYKNNRSWLGALEELRQIADSAGLDIEVQTPVTQTQLVPEDRLKFPYDIFPETVQDYITSHVIQHEYLAAGVLAALGTAVGNSCSLEAMDGYVVKPIMYLAIVAPPGSFKTPALKAAFYPLERWDAHLYKGYLAKKLEYRQKLADWQKSKKGTPEPHAPTMDQTLIKDSTIEMVVKILSSNPGGCCVLADELSGFLNRMNQYKTGDEVQKWLELWSGSPVLLQRISRDENKIEDPFCIVVGGIQPGVLETLSKEQNEHNGFYHRFLFCYPEPMKKAAWQPITIPEIVRAEYQNMFTRLLHMREAKSRYVLTQEAQVMYGQWFNSKNLFYNRSESDAVKGIIAKYQDYCLRFALLLQVVYDGQVRTGLVEATNLERAIRLTEYFFGNMAKSIGLLAPESPVDRLTGWKRKLHDRLPRVFSMKTAVLEGAKIKVKEAAVKNFLYRNGKQLFKTHAEGLEKLY